MDAPTCWEIWQEVDGEFIEVHREADDSWRHGSYVFQVFKRQAEGNNSFWI